MGQYIIFLNLEVQKLEENQRKGVLGLIEVACGVEHKMCHP